MMFWNGGGWAWWQASLMWLGMIAFWALLIWLIYTLVSAAVRRPDTGERGTPPGDARRILDERLARGEIGPEEYQRLRDLIDNVPGRRPAGTGSGR